MTFRPTQKHPGVWPGSEGGYEAGAVAEAIARDPNKQAGGIANAAKHGAGLQTVRHGRGTISGVSKPAEDKETARYLAEGARARAKARGVRA